MARARIVKPCPFDGYDHVPLAMRSSKTCAQVWTIRRDDRAEREAHYFVDEAGDPRLFARGGRLAVGTEGCSKFFILGLAWIVEPTKLEQQFADLRAQILADSYFRKVPSIQQKTSRMFHATDDIPEVRREVFGLLHKHPIQFFANVRDKRSVAVWARSMNEKDPSFKYTQNTLYDSMVVPLVQERLHKDKGYRIVFAKRGSSDRTDAIERAVTQARTNFQNKWGISSAAPVQIVPALPWDTNATSLQATDYLLWSLQRLYERGEDRYLDYVWPLVRLIRDSDDISTRVAGMYYTQDLKLDGVALEKRLSRGI